MKGTNKPKEHMETQLICFDTHRGLPQAEENKYVNTQQRWCQEVQDSIPGSGQQFFL